MEMLPITGVNQMDTDIFHGFYAEGKVHVIYQIIKVKPWGRWSYVQACSLRKRPVVV